MAHVCPWWLGYFLASPLRRLFQDPAKIVSPYVRPGMKVFEPGPGMGFFTLELAKLVGPSGMVMVVDIQPKMLEELRRRAAKSGLLDRLDLRLAQPESMGVDDLRGTFDFALAFALVHEVPSAALFFSETAAALKPGAALLLGEPSGHVTTDKFEAELTAAAQAGFELVDRPSIRRTRAALLRRNLS